MNLLRKIISISIFLLPFIFCTEDLYSKNNENKSEICANMKIGLVNTINDTRLEKVGRALQMKKQKIESELFKNIVDMRTKYEEKIKEIDEKKGILESEKYDKAVAKEKLKLEKQQKDIEQQKEEGDRKNARKNSVYY